MLRRAQLLMNKLGLLAALLFAMGAVWPAAAAVACVEPVEASAQDLQAEAASPLAPPCEDPACEHCVGACGHGCCHAPHVASPHTSAPALPQGSASHDALSWASSPGAPLQAAYGLERPPRV
ncbi:hypothetical protein [Brevundimonas sp.]|uniref:hypothetical protein n=1 Tax=Brevundimonas sp. TaxID=1871086 RepID=UPI003F71A4A6